MTAASAAPSRLARLGAAYVDVVPVVAPLLPLVGLELGGQMKGAGLELVALFLAWSASACLVLLLVNSYLLLRQGQTLGLIYFDLRYRNRAPKRLWTTSAMTLALRFC